MSDQTIVALREAINSHDPNEMAAVFTDDYRCEMPMHPERGFVGNAAVRASWTMMFSRLPDIRARILRDDMNADSGLTWSEWEMIGTTHDGKSITFRGVVISTARDGKIASTRFYIDEIDTPDRS